MYLIVANDACTTNGYLQHSIVPVSRIHYVFLTNNTPYNIPEPRFCQVIGQVSPS
jgi:hypothetical protein